MRLGRSLVAEIAMAWSLDAAMIRKSIVYGTEELATRFHM
jgi:hypothetical protein